MVTRQLSAGSAQQTHQAPVRRLQINSKFDYNNSMFKVVSADEHQGVQAVCVWGELLGQEIHFENLGEVLELVNQKRG